MREKKRFFTDPSGYLDKIEKKNIEVQISKHEVSTFNFEDETFSESFEVELESGKVGELIYLNPFLFTFFNENPFKLQERTYPIDFGYKDVYQHSIKINLNDKYEIVELPKEIVKDLPNNTGQLVFKVVKELDSIVLYFKYDFKEAIYNSQYYKYLKYYLSIILDVEKNSLVILKDKL